MKQDFVELKNALRNEFTRRGKTLPTNDTYSPEPANGVVVYKEAAQELFNDVQLMNNSEHYIVNPLGSIMASDLFATIDYIQTLMRQNTKN